MIKDYFNIYKGNFDKINNGDFEGFIRWFNALTKTELSNFNKWLKQENLSINIEDRKNE